jgi:K+-transporting ATPase ATPase C chain
MFRETVDALRACLVTFVICVVAYPAVVYGVGHALFPKQVEGSLIERDGKVIGSELIAQPFASDRYFQPRPSAAGANGYAADAASGSNLGTKNPALIDRITVDVAKQVVAHDSNADVKARLEKLDSLQSDLKAKNEIKEKTQADTDAIAMLEEGVSAAKSDLKASLAAEAKTAKELVPADLVTASGAGLDPEISPEAADYQATRVASARGADVSKVRDLIARHTERSGESIGAPPRVNVLLLNLDLDKEIPVAKN